VALRRQRPFPADPQAGRRDREIPDDEYASKPPVSLGIQSGRYRYPPEPLAGGKPGSKGNPYGLTQLKPGDVVVMDAAGGGGYGDPLARDADAVAEDVADGYVSVEAARRDYGVVIDPATTKVDREATGELRRPAPRA
jgi:N-methylhydantoinase B